MDQAAQNEPAVADRRRIEPIIAGFILAMNYMYPVADLVRGVFPGTADLLNEKVMLLSVAGLLGGIIDMIFIGLPISGGTLVVLLSMSLAVAGVLPWHLASQLMAFLTLWHLVTVGLRYFLGWLPPGGDGRQLPGPPHDRPEDDQPRGALEQLGVAKRVHILTATQDRTRYLWLNGTGHERQNGGPLNLPAETRSLYLLKLSPEAGLQFPLKLDFFCQNQVETLYTGIQTLVIEPANLPFSVCQLGLEGQSLKRLQDALTLALVARECSDKPPISVNVLRGPDALKDSGLVITVGRVGDGFLVIRREDLELAPGGDEVLAIRAIHFVRRDDTRGALVPPAANAELQRYHGSLLRILFANVIRPFLECTANDPEG